MSLLLWLLTLYPSMRWVDVEMTSKLCNDVVLSLSYSRDTSKEKNLQLVTGCMDVDDDVL